MALEAGDVCEAPETAVVEISSVAGSMGQLARSTQAAPNRLGILFVGAGCGISTYCPRGYPPPQSVLAGITDARLGL